MRFNIQYINHISFRYLKNEVILCLRGDEFQRWICSQYGIIFFVILIQYVRKHTKVASKYLELSILACLIITLLIILQTHMSQGWIHLNMCKKWKTRPNWKSIRRSRNQVLQKDEHRLLRTQHPPWTHLVKSGIFGIKKHVSQKVMSYEKDNDNLSMWLWWRP